MLTISFGTAKIERAFGRRLSIMLSRAFGQFKKMLSPEQFLQITGDPSEAESLPSFRFDLEWRADGTLVLHSSFFYLLSPTEIVLRVKGAYYFDKLLAQPAPEVMIAKLVYMSLIEATGMAEGNPSTA